MISAKCSPANSVVLLADASGGEIPSSLGGAVIAVTPSCIAIGCLSEMDGETEFVMGESADVDPKYSPAFVGTIRTSTRKLTIKSVLDETILAIDVALESTAVRVWLNHEIEPDKVIVGLD